jgi:carbamoyltransferase
MRIGPSHPWLGAAGFHLALPLLEFYYRKLAIYRSESRFARDRVRAIKDKIERGETVYLAGVSAAGIHNSGVALVEVTRNGPPWRTWASTSETSTPGSAPGTMPRSARR